MENFHSDNANRSKENHSHLNIIQLNPVSYIASYNSVSRSSFEFSPSKIQKRLMLTDSGWCRMGTFFSPPDDFLSIQELQYLLDQMNKINHDAGRPNDTDIIIRTASRTGPESLWSEPAFLIENIGLYNQRIKTLADFKDISYQKATNEVKKSWKMYHSDNTSLQKKAIHGRLQVSGDELKLDIGSNISYARALEKKDKIIVNIPVNTAFTFFNIDCFVPDNLTVLGNNLTTSEIYDLLNKYHSAGTQLEKFIDWVSNNLGLHDYVAEFRYYTCNCNPAESFHIMDLDTKF